MLGKWAECSRISFVPLVFGVVFGLCLGKWWFFQPNITKFYDPKITCLILHRSTSYLSINISKDTWLRNCDNYVIVKQIKNKKNLPSPLKTQGSAFLPADIVAVSADNAWGTLCRALYFLPTPLEWLIIVPDSSFVIIENLRDYVRGIDWRKPKYLGHAVNNYLADYNILSAGIVLSYGSVERLLNKFPNNVSCDQSGKYWNNEDIYLGSHLKEIGINVEDTRDPQGGSRFHGYNLNTLLYPGQIFKKSDYFKKAAFPIKEGFRCCSRYLITIDTSDSDHAQIINFLLYGIKLHKKLEKSKIELHSDEASWVKSLREIGYMGPTDNITAEQYYDIWARHIPPEQLGQKLAEAGAQ